MLQPNTSYRQLERDKAQHLLSKSSQSAGNVELLTSTMRRARSSFIRVDGVRFKYLKGKEVEEWKEKAEIQPIVPITNPKTEIPSDSTQFFFALVISLWQSETDYHVFLVATPILINSMLSADVCTKIQQLNLKKQILKTEVLGGEIILK